MQRRNSSLFSCFKPLPAAQQCGNHKIRSSELRGEVKGSIACCVASRALSAFFKLVVVEFVVARPTLRGSVGVDWLSLS